MMLVSETVINENKNKGQILENVAAYNTVHQSSRLLHFVPLSPPLFLTVVAH